MCDTAPSETSYVNIKFPRATYHTIVRSTEELYCLNSENGYEGR